MPQKSVFEIEREIDEALRRCRSLAAEGLWRRMRYLAEHKSERKAHARLNGRPVSSAEQLSKAISCSSLKAAQILPVLLEQELVVENREGYLLPHVAQIIARRAAGAARKSRCVQKQQRRALRNAQKGVTSAQGNTQVTPLVTPSGPSPPPHSPPPAPPRVPLAAQAGEGAAAPPAPAGANGRKKRPALYPSGTKPWFDGLYFELYRERYGNPPVFMVKHGVVTHEVLNAVWATGGGRPEAEAALRRFVADNDPFFRGHDVGHLLAQLPRFLCDDDDPAARARRVFAKPKGQNGEHP